MRFKPLDGILIGLIIVLLYLIGIGFYELRNYLFGVGHLSKAFYTTGPLVLCVIFSVLGTFFDVFNEDKKNDPNQPE